MNLQDTLAQRIINVVSARCQECDYEAPKFHPKDFPELKKEIDEEWEAAGLGEWLQWEWPKRFPAWMVKRGFRCPFCKSPNLLLALEASA